MPSIDVPVWPGSPVAPENYSRGTIASGPTHGAHGRFRDSILLFLAGGALLGAAWASAAHQVRVFSSPYPLWILLALNAAIAMMAGVAAGFVVEPDPTSEDDAGLVRVPRSEWESLQRRLRNSGRENSRRDPVAPLLVVPEVDPGASCPSAPPTPIFRFLPSPPVDLTTGILETDLPGVRYRREQGLLELQYIAEGALFASDNLGAVELAGLIEDSRSALLRISQTLGVLGQEGENPSELLIRLLRLHWKMKETPLGGRFTVANIGRLANRLIRELDPNSLATSFGLPRNELGVPDAEFDAIDRELAPTRRRLSPEIAAAPPT
jgi:hypothetical protein